MQGSVRRGRKVTEAVIWRIIAAISAFIVEVGLVLGVLGWVDGGGGEGLEEEFSSPERGDGGKERTERWANRRKDEKKGLDEEEGRG